jgi:hypothetical protein
MPKSGGQVVKINIVFGEADPPHNEPQITDDWLVHIGITVAALASREASDSEKLAPRWSRQAATFHR